MSDIIVWEMLDAIRPTLSEFVTAELYGLSRQYARGDIRRPFPGYLVSPRSQLRWRAWNRCRGMPRATARELFRGRVISIFMRLRRLP